MSREPAALFERNLRKIQIHTDRVMLVILAAQWALAIVLALTLSPYTWIGPERRVHTHVYVALLLGGCLNFLPMLLILSRPGERGTRQVVAVAQMLWSGLLIHLTGGRIETHFHVFGSLAFLAFYRDWTLLPTATLVVAGDHLLRGVLYPESVYGTTNPEWWRFLEHAGWVVFEDIVLFLGCLRGVADLRVMSEREAALAELNASLEERIGERTTELRAANDKLRASYDEVQSAQRQVIEASRKAGMAEVATSVLHNVGNVLNSVNVSAEVIAQTVERSSSAGVGKIHDLLAKQGPALGSYLDRDGHKIISYLGKISGALGEERARTLAEVHAMRSNIDHIKAIVAMQQAHARAGGVFERLLLSDVIEDALRMHERPGDGQRIEIARELEAVPAIDIDRHKVMQILLNLIANARQSVLARAGDDPGRIDVRLRETPAGAVAIEVADSGVGIPPEAMARIFTFGYTTKKDGHGFGLHHSALSAMELGGSLAAHSDGHGKGAVFTLTLPRTARRSAA